MKQINVYFDDKEYEELIKTKNNLSWHDFIIFLSKNQKKEEKNVN